MKLNHLLWLAVPLSLCMACKNKSSVNETKRTIFLDKANMDTTISPGADFYLYANGNWLRKEVIPASQVMWDSFTILEDENQKNLKKILEEVSSKKNAKGTADQKVAGLYTSGMDTVTIEKLGYSPIKPLLAQINAVKNYKDLINLAADENKEGNSFLFGFGVNLDDKISTKNIVGLSQTGLGLPNRDYYFNTDAATQNIRKEYLKYIAKLFTLTGTDQARADKQASAILDLETAIAKSHSTPTELRDPIKNYNKFAVADFQKQVPDIDLKNAFGRMLVKTDTILVGQPTYYQALNNLLKTRPIAIWKAKVKFEALSHAAPYMSKDFDHAHFDFFKKVLNGAKVKEERWKIVTVVIDGSLGELLGQLYAARYFKPEAKQRMLTLVNNLQAVYKSRIEKLDWMSAETKQRALAKLEAFTKKIGYPDKWKKYDDVQIDHTMYYKNMQSIARHDYQEMIQKLGKPVNKTEWDMTPPTVNAEYDPTFNEIAFPAGILQFPFFDFAADDAINYGAIGTVIGHEMTHGFDDQGRQYDKDGNLKDWWAKMDADQFKTKAQVVVDQYSQYTVLNNLKVNGNLTLGENIADIGGLAIAYQAFKMTEQGKGDVKINGLSPDQRFFLSFAQAFRGKNRDEVTRQLISIDVHSPEIHRVNGSVSNNEAFYRAFNINPGDKMYRPENERVRIW